MLLLTHSAYVARRFRANAVTFMARRRALRSSRPVKAIVSSVIRIEAPPPELLSPT